MVEAAWKPARPPHTATLGQPAPRTRPRVSPSRGHERSAPHGGPLAATTQSGPSDAATLPAGPSQAFPPNTNKKPQDKQTPAAAPPPQPRRPPAAQPPPCSPAARPAAPRTLTCSNVLAINGR